MEFTAQIIVLVQQKLRRKNKKVEIMVSDLTGIVAAIDHRLKTGDVFSSDDLKADLKCVRSFVNSKLKGFVRLNKLVITGRRGRGLLIVLRLASRAWWKRKRLAILPNGTPLQHKMTIK